MRFLRLFGLLLFFVLFLASNSENVYAQSGAGVGIRPATIERSAEPGQTIVESVGVTNLSNSKQIYYIFTKDISGVETGGVPVFADENEETTGFEMSEWISTNVQQLELTPGQEKEIEVTISVPDNATPGSHFGALFASIDPPKLRSVGASVGYDVANIISIRVAGDAIENAQLRSFSTGDYLYGETKVDFNARIENKGTVLVRPVGPLEIYNMFGKRVSLLTFNDNKSGIFPLTTREFNIEWTSDDIGFGRYQAVLSLIYGEKGRQSTISSTATFWILPMNIILPAVGVLAFLLLAIYISIKLYIRKTLRRAGGARQRIARRSRSGQGTSLLLLVTIVMLAVTALFLIILLALFA